MKKKKKKKKKRKKKSNFIREKIAYNVVLYTKWKRFKENTYLAR